MNVDVQIATAANDVPPVSDIQRWVAAAVAAKAADPAAEVSVRVVDEDEMQTLNRDYRDQDKPTNVLSFPAGAVQGLPTGADTSLGDIVVCATVVAREASEQGKPLDDHWGHMLVHGVLHLLGHDHMAESEADEMERLEREILAGLGIADPYEGN
jgi:probable rRNA maturation factor